jgi:hypothetical protein
LGEDGNLINYALPENGAVLSVSEDNPNHPGSTLNNGNTRSEDWDKGEGWQLHFNGPYAYGRYSGSGQTTGGGRRRGRMPVRQPFGEVETGSRQLTTEDYKWHGLGGDGNRQGAQSAMGWVVIEFPEEKLVNRVEVYTLDTEELPASKYGVNHLLLQYWTPQANSWQNVDRYGKSKEQKSAGIRDIKTGKISIRFKHIKTEKIRLAILWTNDSKKHPGQGGRRQEIVEGTIRLVEVEVYGTEKKEDANTTTTGEWEETLARGEELDLLLKESPTGTK